MPRLPHCHPPTLEPPDGRVAHHLIRQLLPGDHFGGPLEVGPLQLASNVVVKVQSHRQGVHLLVQHGKVPELLVGHLQDEAACVSDSARDGRPVTLLGADPQTCMPASSRGRDVARSRKRSTSDSSTELTMLRAKSRPDMVSSSSMS